MEGDGDGELECSTLKMSEREGERKKNVNMDVFQVWCLVFFCFFVLILLLFRKLKKKMRLMDLVCCGERERGMLILMAWWVGAERLRVVLEVRFLR